MGFCFTNILDSVINISAHESMEILKDIGEGEFFFMLWHNSRPKESEHPFLKSVFRPTPCP